MVKVKVDFSKFKNINSEITTQDLQRVASDVVSQSKTFISKGISPVKGVRRFAGYAAQRDNDNTKYPFSVQSEFPDKKLRPVNLTLEGGYLDRFEGWVEGKSAYVGFRNPSQKTLDLYESHNLGTNENRNVPRRQHLPVMNDNEEFNVSIQQQILKNFERIVDKIINKLNKKD